MAEDEQRVTQSVKIYPSIWREAKVAAAKRGLTVSALVESAIMRDLRRMGERRTGE